jgi:ABC-2 type transport system permease protein
VLALYVRLVRAGFDRHASYGAASLAGMFTNVVFGMLRVGVLLAVLGGSGTVAGYDTATTVTYVWLGQGLLAVVSLWTDGELAERVRTGDIALDLARPWNLQAALAATDLGRAAHAMLVRFVPPVVLGALLFPFRWPHSPLTWLAFAASVLLAVLVCGQIKFLLELTAFWLLDSRGVRALWAATSGVLCGLVVPLAYFPDWARRALADTPCPSVLQTPIDVFTERGNPAALLGVQLFWAVLLAAAGRAVLARATRRLVVQGG